MHNWKRHLEFFVVSGTVSCVLAALLLLTWKYSPATPPEVRAVSFLDWLPSLLGWMPAAFCLGANLGGLTAAKAEISRVQKRRKNVEPHEWAALDAASAGYPGERIYYSKPDLVTERMSAAFLFWLGSFFLPVGVQPISVLNPPSFLLVLASTLCGVAALLQNRQMVLLRSDTIEILGSLTCRKLKLADICALRFIRVNVESWRAALIVHSHIVLLPADIAVDPTFVRSVVLNPDEDVRVVDSGPWWRIRQTFFPRWRTIEQSAHVAAKGSFVARTIAFIIISWALIAEAQLAPWVYAAFFLCSIGFAVGGYGLRVGAVLGGVTCIIVSAAMVGLSISLNLMPWQLALAGCLVCAPTLIGGLKATVSLRRGYDECHPGGRS